MEQNGAFRIYGADIDKVVKTCLVEKDGAHVINRKYVGRNASVILRDSGIVFSGEPRIIIAEVSVGHPFIETEMLMPVLGCARVVNIDDAIEEAYKAEHNCKHSAQMHSTNVHNMSRAVRRLNTTIFVKNAPSYAGLGFGGEGYPTLTIATPTGEGLTSARSFTRSRRCVLYGDFRII
jgi:propionaldehyde dehydrogenase